MGTEAAFGQYADYPILRHISKVLIVLSECNLVPVAGITLALAWTLDLQINSDGKSGKTGNNLFSNKPLGSQLIATVSPVTGTGNHLKQGSVHFCWDLLNNSPHFVSIASVYLPLLGDKNRVIQFGQTRSQEPSFLLLALVFM